MVRHRHWQICARSVWTYERLPKPAKPLDSQDHTSEADRQKQPLSEYGCTKIGHTIHMVFVRIHTRLVERLTNYGKEEISKEG
jgi:hypothetical protein